MFQHVVQSHVHASSVDLLALYAYCRGSNTGSVIDFRWARTRRSSTFMTTKVKACDLGLLGDGDDG